MKRLILLMIVFVMLVTILVSCTKEQGTLLTGKYDKETEEYILSNESDKDFFDLNITICFNNPVYIKEETYVIAVLKAGTEYVIDLSEHVSRETIKVSVKEFKFK